VDAITGKVISVGHPCPASYAPGSHLGRTRGGDSDFISGLGHRDAIGDLAGAAFARRFDGSAYAATYVALVEAFAQPLITGDLRLYRAVREQLEWVQWLGDYNG
jgi:hypothetical protein